MTGLRIIEASQAIRLYLPTLLPAAKASKLDHSIGLLLTNADQAPNKTAEQLERLLAGNRVTRAWMERFLRGADPSSYEERLIDLTTPPQPVYAPKYQCGTCGYVWYRRSGTEPPPCPQDGCDLIADGGTA